jgi:VWFA-related protein
MGIRRSANAVRPLCAFFMLWLLFANGYGQDPRPTPPKQTPPEEVGEGDVLRVNTTLVGVPVIVLDSDGRFVRDLKQSDFHVYQDGIEQPIAYFASFESNVTVLLLFDKFVKKPRQTAIVFTEKLGMGDQVLVAKFGDTKYEILTKVSEVETNLQKETKKVKWRFGGGEVHDAVDGAIKRMNSIQGRKAIVLFSDGVYSPNLIVVTPAIGRIEPTWPSEAANASSTINEAEKSDSPIYVMGYDTFVEPKPITKNDSYPETAMKIRLIYLGWYRTAIGYLRALAEKSGGRLYRVASGPRYRQVENPPGLTDGLTEIIGELQQQYSLGYYPKGGLTTERHQIEVRVAKPGLVVRSRTSYTPSRR